MHGCLVRLTVLAGAGLLLLAAVILGLVAIVRWQRHERAAALVPFYVPPEPLPAGRPGDLIRREPIDAPSGVRAWRVLYHSTDSQGSDIAVSGLIAAPETPPPTGGFPVIAVAHGTVGMARTCAPSLDPFAGRGPLPSFLTPPKDRTSFFEQMVEPFTSAGYAVAATDYRGLGTPGINPYLVGEDAGRNVLDAARLIRRFPEVQVTDQTLIWGHSQGGQASAFAGQIAPRYAPELRVLGVVAGSPAAMLGMLADEVASIEDRSPLTGLIVMIARAWSSAYPDLDAATVLTRRGVGRMDVVERDCIDGVLLAFASRPAPDYVEDAGIKTPAWQERIAQNTPGAIRTAPPILVFQGGADKLILPQFTRAFVQRLCAAGDTVIFNQYPGDGHLSVITPSMPATLTWIEQRLAGQPAPTTC